MIANDFLVENADYELDLDALRKVRETVFVQEQKVPIELEWDELDPLSQHVLARDLDGEPVGTGRLTPKGKIGRMAVMAEWRGRGVGAVLLQTLVERAQAMRYSSVALNAQVSAMGFYQRFGFVAYGERFDEAGIEHQAMRRELEPPQGPPVRKPAAVPDSRILDCDSFEGLHDATLELISSARRRLWIYSRDLDPVIYARPEIMEALRQLALRAEDGALRILLQKPGAAREAAHPLIPLAQRLSSTFVLRQPDDEHDLQYPGAFLLNDVGGYLFRPLASRPEISGNTYGPARQQQLLEYFKQVWERAIPCAELRQIAI